MRGQAGLPQGQDLVVSRPSGRLLGRVQTRVGRLVSSPRPGMQGGAQVVVSSSRASTGKVLFIMSVLFFQSSGEAEDVGKR